ncbi:hypothetical protein [Chryseobacterium sp.]|uniref:hypothetical protein n=1 Tax=Chryseobacterium sp. TaxID=1871047 RepID=UPI0025C2F188|nr:hypothetical protein [Chryseobacterium sp.]
MKNKPLKIGLIIVLILASLSRVLKNCSGKEDRASYINNELEAQQSLRKEVMDFESAQQQKEDLESIIGYRDLFYASYDSINKLGRAEKLVYRVKKVEKDSLLQAYQNMDVKVKANSFVQNNNADSLRFAIKFPDNTSVFIRDYETKDPILESFKALKKKKKIQNITLLLDEPESKFVSYNYKNKGIQYNGLALLSKKDNKLSSVEFESDKLSTNDLRQKARILSFK